MARGGVVALTVSADCREVEWAEPVSSLLLELKKISISGLPTVDCELDRGNELSVDFCVKVSDSE